MGGPKKKELQRKQQQQSCVLFCFSSLFSNVICSLLPQLLHCTFRKDVPNYYGRWQKVYLRVCVFVFVCSVTSRCAKAPRKAFGRWFACLLDFFCPSLVRISINQDYVLGLVSFATKLILQAVAAKNCTTIKTNLVFSVKGTGAAETYVDFFPQVNVFFSFSFLWFKTRKFISNCVFQLQALTCFFLFRKLLNPFSTHPSVCVS